MKLIKKTQTGALAFRLKDGRIGTVYNTGYVRVTIKRNNPNPLTDLNSAHSNYQINQQVKVCSKYRDFTYDIQRVLIECECERIEFLQAFENKNCN